MKNNFDNFAKMYSDCLHELPEEYISLIKNTFYLNKLSRVVDIGCGSGLLTFPLSKISQNVLGIDISHNMIEIAKKHTGSDSITWIEKDIDHYKFANLYYDLIIAYESIHLFQNTEKLLRNCLAGLKHNGFLCMGWCFYNWELILQEEIVGVFKHYGIDWGEWGFQKFDYFKNLLNSGIISGLSYTEEKFINVYQEWAVEQIVVHLTSISKVVGLNKKNREKTRNSLFESITKKYGNTISGDTQFWIRYSQKR